MNKQSNAQYPHGFNKQENSIKGYSPILMQQVKVYTTAIWIKNWRGKQMINIYQNSGQHN